VRGGALFKGKEGRGDFRKTTSQTVSTVLSLADRGRVKLVGIHHLDA
jgi:hypothetical protein